MKNTYYRKNYMIGLYSLDKYETCLTVVDNSHEFADLMEISFNSATVILHDAFNNKRKYIIYCGKRVKIEFIEND